jgi:Fuc2NAc and GlcNAc transferase
MMMIYFTLVAFTVALLLTGYYRRYAITKSIMDIPNYRSSHKDPTPRGGGVAFVLVLIIIVPCLSYTNNAFVPFSVAFLCAGGVVALVGFYDDFKPVSTTVRLLSHFGAAGFVLYCMGGMPSIVLGDLVLTKGILLNILALIYLVWLLNLYNFMDGIDGLAAVEAVSVFLSGALLYWWVGDFTALNLPLTIAAAVAGFLAWNFPRARIFMGDVGSGFLGLTVGLMSIQAAVVKQSLFLSWIILLGVFIVDATITLVTRMLRGQKIYEAHRDHAYQHAALHYQSHVKVTLGILMVNIFWLLPIAIQVQSGIFAGLTWVIIAYIPLIAISLMFKAGREVKF